MNARERRAAELAASATEKQAQLKREAAERRAIRAAQTDGGPEGTAAVGRDKSTGKLRSPN